MGRACNLVQDIAIDFYFEIESEDGDKTISATGLDGKIYRLTKPNPEKLKALKEAVSDESKQMDYLEWLRKRRPNDSEQGGNPNGNPTEPCAQIASASWAKVGPPSASRSL